MGFFTKLAQQARIEGAALNAVDDYAKLKKLGVSKLDSNKFILNDNTSHIENLNRQGDVVVKEGKGYAVQDLQKNYGINTKDANFIVKQGRRYVDGDYEGNELLRNLIQKKLKNAEVDLAPGYVTRKRELGKELDKALAEGNLPLADVYQDAIDSTGVYKQVRNIGKVAAENNYGTSDLKADIKNKRMAGNLPPMVFDTIEAQHLGDKDFRNELVNREVQVARQFFPEDASMFDVIDALQDIDARRGPMMAEALRNDPEIQRILQKEKMGGYVRSAKPEGFVGEGMFGQVREFAPGYVVKKQGPVVEWPPINDERGYALHDARDVAAEVRDLRQLEGLGISPKVEAFDINPDGSSEIIFRDLRDNYDTLDTVDSIIEKQLSRAKTAKEKTNITNNARSVGLKNVQQQLMANQRGLELNDRHGGNVLVNKMSGRPMQIDISASPVEGFGRDAAIGSNSVIAMRSAGLIEEADILDGLLQDAYIRKDAAAFHDLAQQGASRAMKLKKYQNVPSASSLV